MSATTGRYAKQDDNGEPEQQQHCGSGEIALGVHDVSSRKLGMGHRFRLTLRGLLLRRVRKGGNIAVLVLNVFLEPLDGLPVVGRLPGQAGRIGPAK